MGDAYASPVTPSDVKKLSYVCADGKQFTMDSNKFEIMRASNPTITDFVGACGALATRSEDEGFYDVEFCWKEQKVFAHRAMLSQKSCVFKTCFLGKYKEATLSSNGKVSIDMDKTYSYTAFKTVVIRFIITDLI